MSTLADISEATRGLSLEELKKSMSTVGQRVQEKEQSEPQCPRVAGLHEGMARVADDFDEPLPEKFWLGKDT